jgi:hypothetical protein
MVGELLNAIKSWETFFFILLVFGFAPGAVLRLIVLAFHRDDPRRREMLAELHRVPRWERPLWVCDQLVVALYEGIWERVVWAATGRVIWRWRLNSGVRLNRQHPDTFEIPDQEERQAVAPGAVVKLMFTIDDIWGRHKWGERMWVEVVAVEKRHLVGKLLNQPLGIPRLGHGDQVKFRREHIIDIDWEGDSVCEFSSDDPEDNLRPVHEGCNRYAKDQADDPELPAPREGHDEG